MAYPSRYQPRGRGSNSLGRGRGPVSDHQIQRSHSPPSNHTNVRAAQQSGNDRVDVPRHTGQPNRRQENGPRAMQNTDNPGNVAGYEQHLMSSVQGRYPRTQSRRAGGHVANHYNDVQPSNPWTNNTSGPASYGHQLTVNAPINQSFHRTQRSTPPQFQQVAREIHNADLAGRSSPISSLSDHASTIIDLAQARPNDLNGISDDAEILRQHYHEKWHDPRAQRDHTSNTSSTNLSRQPSGSRTNNGLQGPTMQYPSHGPSGNSHSLVQGESRGRRNNPTYKHPGDRLLHNRGRGGRGHSQEDFASQRPDASGVHRARGPYNSPSIDLNDSRSYDFATRKQAKHLVSQDLSVNFGGEGQLDNTTSDRGFRPNATGLNVMFGVNQQAMPLNFYDSQFGLNSLTGPPDCPNISYANIYDNTNWATEPLPGPGVHTADQFASQRSRGQALPVSYVDGHNDHARDPRNRPFGVFQQGAKDPTRNPPGIRDARGSDKRNPHSAHSGQSQPPNRNAQRVPQQQRPQLPGKPNYPANSTYLSGRWRTENSGRSADISTTALPSGIPTPAVTRPQAHPEDLSRNSSGAGIRRIPGQRNTPVQSRTPSPAISELSQDRRGHNLFHPQRVQQLVRKVERHKHRKGDRRQVQINQKQNATPEQSWRPPKPDRAQAAAMVRQRIQAQELPVFLSDPNVDYDTYVPVIISDKVPPFARNIVTAAEWWTYRVDKDHNAPRLLKSDPPPFSTYKVSDGIGKTDYSDPRDFYTTTSAEEDIIWRALGPTRDQYEELTRKKLYRDELGQRLNMGYNAAWDGIKQMICDWIFETQKPDQCGDCEVIGTDGREHYFLKWDLVYDFEKKLFKLERWYGLIEDWVYASNLQQLDKYKDQIPVDADGKIVQHPDAYACDRCKKDNTICYGHREDPDRICVPCQIACGKRTTREDGTSDADWRIRQCCTKAADYTGTRVDWTAKGKSAFWENIRLHRAAKKAGSGTPVVANVQQAHDSKGKTRTVEDLNEGEEILPSKRVRIDLTEASS